MRKTILAIITGIAIGLLVGCGAGTNAEHDKQFVEWDECNHVSVIMDKATGVHYVCYWMAQGVGITPRLNADGTLYTGE